MASIASVRTSFDYVAFQQAVVEEIATPFITMPTRDYAHIMAYIRLIGGDPNDAVAGTTYYPASDSEPDVDDAPANSLKWRAVKDIFWAKGKMTIYEKMALIGQLVMHDTVPKPENAPKRICMEVLAKQAGMSANTATRSLDANIEHGFVQHRHLRAGNVAGPVRTALETNPTGVDAAGLEMSDVIRRSAGHDAVVIGRIALRFGEALLAACRAAVPVSELRGLAVERLNDEFRIDCHFVDGAIGPIDELFGMAEGPALVVADVAGVGARGGIAAIQLRCERGVTNLADEAAVSDGFKFSVPARSDRKPDFKTDMRVAGGR